VVAEEKKGTLVFLEIIKKFIETGSAKAVNILNLSPKVVLVPEISEANLKSEFTFQVLVKEEKIIKDEPKLIITPKQIDLIPQQQQPIPIKLNQVAPVFIVDPLATSVTDEELAIKTINKNQQEVQEHENKPIAMTVTEMQSMSSGVSETKIMQRENKGREEKHKQSKKEQKDKTKGQKKDKKEKKENNKKTKTKTEIIKGSIKVGEQETKEIEKGVYQIEENKEVKEIDKKSDKDKHKKKIKKTKAKTKTKATNAPIGLTTGESKELKRKTKVKKNY